MIFPQFFLTLKRFKAKQKKLQSQLSVSSDNESNFSENIFQTQQTTQSDLTDELFLQQANFKKISDPKSKTIKKYLFGNLVYQW